jgi:hypothetical protein
VIMAVVGQNQSTGTASSDPNPAVRSRAALRFDPVPTLSGGGSTVGLRWSF